VMVLRVSAGLDRRFDDMCRGGEIRLAGAKPHDILACGPQRLGFGVNGERGGLSDGGNAGRNPVRRFPV
jgi:hypothetical protein